MTEGICQRELLGDFACDVGDPTLGKVTEIVFRITIAFGHSLCLGKMYRL